MYRGSHSSAHQEPSRRHSPAEATPGLITWLVLKRISMPWAARKASLPDRRLATCLRQSRSARRVSTQVLVLSWWCQSWCSLSKLVTQPLFTALRLLDSETNGRRGCQSRAFPAAPAWGHPVYLPQDTYDQGTNNNVPLEKTGRCHLNPVTKVNITMCVALRGTQHHFDGLHAQNAQPEFNHEENQ